MDVTTSNSTSAIQAFLDLATNPIGTNMDPRNAMRYHWKTEGETLFTCEMNENSARAVRDTLSKKLGVDVGLRLVPISVDGDELSHAERVKQPGKDLRAKLTIDVAQPGAADALVGFLQGDVQAMRANAQDIAGALTHAAVMSADRM